MARRSALKLFEAFGVELEYIIVNRGTLDILPICDEVLAAKAGEPVSDVDDGALSWSNELVLHVIELKTNGPSPTLSGLGSAFGEGVVKVNAILAPRNAMLMPSAMHPWMNPYTETRIWPHEYTEVYRTFDRIFNCSGHGWSNLQSTHLNLPYSGSREFGRLHAAIRLVLPIIPAIAASSPIVQQRATGLLDNRLEYYRNNCAKVPQATGHVIPEQVFGIKDYKDRVLGSVYNGFAPYDPEGVLRHEWANARGAIARFDRGAIEIRVVDVQECPAADIAVLSAIVAAIRGFTDQRLCGYAMQKSQAVEPLSTILLETLAKGEAAVITNRDYLALFGVTEAKLTAGELWRHIVNRELPGEPSAPVEARECLEVIFRYGTLSTRILRALNGDYSRESLARVYGKLCTCLATNVMFE